MTDYYKILGVSRTASSEEIKQKYREMAKKHHPDANGNSRVAEEKFKAINEAYSVLSSPSSRAEYDSSFYDDNIFNKRQKEHYNRKTNERTGSNTQDGSSYFYTFYYTNNSKQKRYKHRVARPFLSILKGVAQLIVGGFLLRSFVGFFPIFGIYIAFLGIENIKNGISSLS